MSALNLNEVLSRTFAAAPPPAASLHDDAEVFAVRYAAFTPQLRAVDEAKRTITFVASTETIDRYGDRIKIAGMNLDAYKKNPVVLWAHRAGELPVGKSVEVHKESSPAPVLVHTVQFADHPFAQQVHDLYKGKFLNSVSVGFRPTEQPTRILDEQGTWKGGYEFGGSELLEISCVPLPANPEAVARALDAGILTPGDVERYFSSAKGGGQLATKADWDSLFASLERLQETLARVKGRIREAKAEKISTAEEFERALRGGAN
jgi:HK97 family phage prohead protease